MGKKSIAICLYYELQKKLSATFTPSPKQVTKKINHSLKYSSLQRK